MPTVLGIDLGTQNVKVVFYDSDKRETVAVKSAPLDLYQTEDGVAEQQANWWVDALHQALHQVDKSVRVEIAAIGVSGQQHGFVPIDRLGNVQAPVKLWCDTSTAAECEAIMDAFGGAHACLSELGNLILPGYTASKVRWYRDAQPDLYADMDCILLPHDYLNFYLTGERCMEVGDASGTGFFDVRTRTWSEKLLRAIDPDRDLRSCLPEPRIGNEAVGALLPSIAQNLGLPSGIPVSIGGGDNMMGAIGTGNVLQGVVTMSLGTSGTVYAYSDQPIIDPDGDIAAFCSSTGGWMPLLCTMNCTVSTELMRNLLDVDIASFETQIASAPRGADGVMTIPFFNGERTPDLPNAKACVIGMDSRNTRSENLLRSAVEGATFALRNGIDRLAELGMESKEIVLIGGGAKSDTWCQIVADVCGTPVTFLKHCEGAAFGAALQALDLIDDASDIQQLTDQHLERDESRCCTPSDSAVSFYNDIYREYQRAVDKITALYS